ncbi:MAG: QueG-associated DUF1730 domain-containing protein, partial [Gammaproteobacteria bacterium]
MTTNTTHPDYNDLTQDIKHWGMELGFQQVGITDTQLAEDEINLLNWLNSGMHGEMTYMERHGIQRSRPANLLPGTLRIISVRMDYLPPASQLPAKVLGNPELAYISRYATGRDYHKLMRLRLQKLANKIETVTGHFNYHVF